MKTKKLTLDETWVLCLRMWKWIAKQVRVDSKLDVEKLKDEWLERNWKGEPLEESCFFCEYAATHNREAKGYRGDCPCGRSTCPAAFVDKQFSCVDNDCNYNDHPIPFYNKLVSLNRKRLKAKAKSNK